MSPAVARRMGALGATLRRVGWEVRELDLDLHAGRLTVEAHRDDGRWLRLTADPLGRVHLERWHRRIVLRGVPQSPHVDDQFLGRQRCEGSRSGLRRLCGYVAANPAPGREALPAPAVRRALAPVMA